MSDPNILLELDLKHFSERMIPLSNLVCFEFLNTDRPRVNEYDVEDLLEKVDEYFDSKFLLQSTHESALQCAKACLKNPYCFTFVFCVNPECEDEDKPNCFKFSHYCPNIPAYYEYRVGLQTYIRLPEPMEGYELHSLKQINSIKVQPYWTSQDSDLDNCRVQCEASLICESFLYSPTYLGGMLSGNCGLYDRSCQECIDPGRQFFYIKIRSQVEMEVPPNYGVTAKGNVNNVTAADQVIEELVGYDLFENAKCQMSDPAAEKLLANSNGTAKYCADQCDLVPTCRGFVFFTGTPEVCRSHYNVCSTVVYTDPEDLSMSLFYNKTENTIWSQDNHTSRVADSDFYDYDEVRTFATPKLSTTTTTTASATVKTIPATTLTTMSSSVVNPLRQMNILIVISLVLI